MLKMLLSFVSTAAVILAFMVPCEGTGHAVVTLRKYKNPSHRLSNGKCCDHLMFNFGRCYPCDAYFKLCVSQAAFGSSSSSCNIGQSETGVVGDRDDHSFNIRKSFSFNTFQGALAIIVQVWDKDKFTNDDFVGSPSITLPSVTPGTSRNPLRKSLTLRERGVTVTLDLELYCDANYYGPRCSVKCVPRDDSSGHYTCDSQGRKVCRRHWYGNSCTRSCVPRDDWRGHYTCDKEGNKICRSRWEGPSCNRCVKNWFGSRCSSYCVPQDSDEKGHYKCRPSDGLKVCLPTWFGAECITQCIPRDDDSGHFSCAHDGSKKCLDGWFGENCTVFCVPQTDHHLGNYTCDNEGNKLCLDGVRRFDGNCSLTCLIVEKQVNYDCIDEGVKECHPSWYGPDCAAYCVPHNDTVNGHYTCDERDGSKVCLKGWEGQNCRFRSQEELFTIE
ncbi:hypothetical protein ACROYT_G012788 [Oculina patagonica]